MMLLPRRYRHRYLAYVFVVLVVVYFVSQFKLFNDRLPASLTSTMDTKTTSMSANSKTLKASKLHVNSDLKAKEKQPTTILVIACNRVSVSRCIDLLLKYRPNSKEFPIVVSQDCDHVQTKQIIQSYGDQLTYIVHPDNSPIAVPLKMKKFLGYYKIARHFKWALGQVFDVFKSKAVIIVEDDLEISSDFFSYFMSAYPIMLQDPTVYCISAWNDNGMINQIENKPELLYRTDFFPGLGWMLTDSLWDEFRSNWPASFWDDWMRESNIRKNRSCIRPEVPRTSTFGSRGISNGLFFEKHLKFVKKNENFVDFSKIDLSYLLEDKYAEAYPKQAYAVPLVTMEQVLGQSSNSPCRIHYSGYKEFAVMAKKFAIMPDERSLVPRTAYKGIITFMFKGRRIYLTPLLPWSIYSK